MDITRFDIEPGNYNAVGNIRLDSYSPNEISYTANLSGKSFVVFSEIYYPQGWYVEMDGNPVEMVRADYVLRALLADAGEHTIVFRFRPASYYTGNMVMMGFSIILTLVFLASIFLSMKRGKASV